MRPLVHGVVHIEHAAAHRLPAPCVATGHMPHSAPPPRSDDRGAAMEAPLGTWTCEALEEMATFCRAPVACPCEDRGAPAHTERRGQRLCRYEVVIDRGEVSGAGACSVRPSAPGGPCVPMFPRTPGTSALTRWRQAAFWTMMAARAAPGHAWPQV